MRQQQPWFLHLCLLSRLQFGNRWLATLACPRIHVPLTTVGVTTSVPSLVSLMCAAVDLQWWFYGGARGGGPCSPPNRLALVSIYERES